MTVVRPLVAVLVSLASFEAPTAQIQPARPAESVIRIDGANELRPLAAEMRRAFQEQNESIVVALGAGLGSRERLEALANGSIDIALAGPGLDAAELARRGMVAIPIALTPVVFAVHSDVTRLDLSSREVCDIFAGRVTNWSALGGADLPVKAFVRPDTEVDMEVVRAGLPCMRHLAPARTVTVARTAREMVAALQSTPGAIGIATTSSVRQSIVALRSLSLDQVAPTRNNVAAGRYPLVRPAYLVTLAARAPAVSAFLDFASSERGVSIVEAIGAVPVPALRP